MQEIIVYIIVALAGGGTVYYLYRKWKALRKNTTNAACSGCPLKQNCTQLRPSSEKDGCSIKEKSPES